MNSGQTSARSAAGLPALVLFLLLVPAGLRAQAACGPGQPPCPYTASLRLKDYVTRTAGPRALFSSGVSAGIQQARGAPYAWGGGMEGYGRRYASVMGKRAIANTVQLGVEAMLGQDSRYVPSRHSANWPRIQDAVKHSFLIRSRSGGRELAVGRVVAALGAGLLSRTWQPEGHNTIGVGFSSAGITFGSYIGGNVFREFWPNLSRHIPF